MVTGEQVKAAAPAAGIKNIPHHKCAICCDEVGYVIDDSGNLNFHSACSCSWSPPSPHSWERAAAWINMQTRSDPKWGDVGAQTAALFGLTLDPLPTTGESND